MIFFNQGSPLFPAILNCHAFATAHAQKIDDLFPDPRYDTVHWPTKKRIGSIVIFWYFCFVLHQFFAALDF